MPFEVALLEWGDGRDGVRLLGRSSAPDLVETVRAHLVDRLSDDEPSESPRVHRLWPVPSPTDGEGDGGAS